MQLLHDGAPAHRTRAITAYLNANNVNIIDSPHTPKIIIENIWDELNCRVKRTGAIPTTLNQAESKNYLRVEQPSSELLSVVM